jgi:4-amino-4-deoxy-L-arabinose transferase-like glycosyltransferase
VFDVFRGWRIDRYAALALWVFAMAVFSWDRPLFPLDETRYVAVAWEMWLRGEYLSPSLNGIFYEHKPPLLFWMLQLGWATGAIAFWTKFLPILIAVSTGLVLCTVARRAYGHEAAPLAALIYLGTLGVSLQAPLVMFDGLVTLCLAISMLPLVQGCREGSMRAWAMSGVGLGLGLLAKGPIIFLYYLPLVLMAPRSWREVAGTSRWFLGAALALVTALALFLMWIGPLLMDDSVRGLFFAQVFDRVSAGDANLGHNRPIWIYLIWAPVLLMPWVFVRPLWPAGDQSSDTDRWLLRSAILSLIFLSLISNKQPHYLLPIVAMLAPMWAGAWVAASRKRRAWVLAILATIPVLLGAMLMLVRASAMGTPDGAWLSGVSPAWAVLVLMIGGIVPRLWYGWRGVVLVFPSAAIMMVLGLGYLPAAGDRVSVEPMSEVVAAAVADDRPVAFLGRYHGQFNFVGRLPLVTIEVLSAEQVRDWIQSNPDGLLVTRGKRTEVMSEVLPEAAQLYRSGVLFAYRAGDLVDAEVVFRDCQSLSGACSGTD